MMKRLWSRRSVDHEYMSPIFEFTLVVKEPSDRITLANFSSSGAVIFTNSKGEIFSAAAPDYRLPQLVVDIGSPCTALQSCGDRDGAFTILASTINQKIYWIDSATKEMHWRLTTHKTKIRFLEIRRPTEDIMLSVSKDVVVLWDLMGRQSLCKHFCTNELGFLAAQFLPPKGYLSLFCSRDGILSLCNTRFPDRLETLINENNLSSFEYRCISPSINGSLVFAAGSSPLVHVWELKNSSQRRLIHILNLGVKSILQIQCVPVMGESLLLLDSDGRLRLVCLDGISERTELVNSHPNAVDVESIMFLSSTDPLILEFAVAPLASLIVALSQFGGFMIFDLSDETGIPFLHHPEKSRLTNFPERCEHPGVKRSLTRQDSVSHSAVCMLFNLILVFLIYLLYVLYRYIHA